MKSRMSALGQKLTLTTAKGHVRFAPVSGRKQRGEQMGNLAKTARLTGPAFMIVAP